MSITYKNIGYSSKTFYGITFKPGDIREVPGYINASGMSRVDGVTSITTTSTPVPKKRSYTRKAITAESKLPDSTSTTIEDDNKLEEELANG